MEFTFDLSQTPVIGRRFLHKTDESSSKTLATPRRSFSISPADVNPQSGWKRPWMCQVTCYIIIVYCYLIYFTFRVVLESVWLIF